MEQYYGDVLAPTSKHHWIIDPFAVTNLPELPLCVAEEFTEIGLNLRTKFLSIRLKKTPKNISEYFLLGFSTFNLSDCVSICDSTTDSVCDFLALQSSI